jgi:cell division septum initiation protein DivIVA
MSKKTIILEDFDFGFSAVSEDELAIREKEAEDRARAEAEQIIKQQQQEASGIIDELTDTADEYRNRLMMLHKMVTPLLNNLMLDSDNKPYIYWPDRKKKMQEFKARIDAVVNND